MPKTNGAKEPASISFSIPVLSRLDKYCYRTDLDRSYVVNRAVKKFLASEMADDPDFWELVYDQCEEKS